MNRLDQEILPNGQYFARAVSCTTAQNKDGTKECFVVAFELESEPPSTLHYRGWLTERTEARTLDSLRYCGWDSDDALDAMRPEVIGRNRVLLTVSIEEYDGRLRNVVSWVNDPNRPAKGGLDASANKLLAARLRGAAIASRQRLGLGVPAKPAATQPSNSAGASARNAVDSLLARAAQEKAVLAAAEFGFSREPGDDDLDLL